MWDQNRLYYEVVLPFSKVLEEMEVQGFKIDIEKMNQADDEFTDRLQKCEKEIHHIAGREFNIGSVKQLSTVLYDELKIPNYVEDYSLRGGKWSLVKDEFFTDKEEKWNREHPEAKVKGTSTDVFALKKIGWVYKHPIVESLLEYKRLAKLKSTYIDGIRKLIAPDGKVHSTFFQLTYGGRPVSNAPNLLQIPSRSKDGKKIKDFFVVDSDEYDLVSMDFSAMELRFLAWLSQDRVMFKAFNQGTDVHSLMCSNIKQFGLTYEQSCQKENKTKRFCAKTTNFLIVFGGGYDTLQDQLLKYGDIYISKKDCYEFLNTFYATFPDIEALQNKVFDYVDKNGYIKNLMGRKRYFMDLLNKPKTDRKEEIDAFNKMKSAAHRAAFSHYISSSSSGDYSAYKAVLLKKLIKENGFDAKFKNEIYDAIYIQIHKSQTDKFIPMMEELMSRPDDPVTINLPVEIGKGKNWGEV